MLNVLCSSLATAIYECITLLSSSMFAPKLLAIRSNIKLTKSLLFLNDYR